MFEQAPKKILIVDDEQDILNALTKSLTRRKFEVYTATNGYDAIGSAQQNKPDLIILDIMLPDMDGKQVARVLSDEPETQKIPIIFLSGVATAEEATKGEIYHHDLLTKPVPLQGILAAIQKVFPKLDIVE
jgi:DNA-binding response OmpR family regulator